ncbi:LamG-like jellyroll fold domain-containing protein, partial [Flavobacterium lacisediminis]
TPVFYAQGATASALTATVGANGTGLLWYTTATGGVGSATAPTPSTATVGNTSYWVSSTNANGCESARTEIVVTVSLPATHLNFDGSNDMVGLGSSLSSTLNGANFFTAEAWINVPNTTGVKTIVGNHISNGAQFNLRIDGSRLNGFLGFGAYGANTSVGSIVANTWHHVAMVYNDTTLKLYIDGIEAASVNIPLAYSLQTSAQPYMIGASGYGGEFFNGSIDEVKIWNIAKTPDQLLATKNCELQGTESGLIAYYKFNQGVDQANNSAITTLLATTGPNGTITNFTLNGSTSNFLVGSPVATGSIVPSVASVTTPVTYNQGDTASALTATTGANGTGLMWYTTATGGTGSTTAPTPSTATAGNTSYWVSSTNANGCESTRVEIVVTVNAPAPATHLNFDGIDDVVDLGSGLTTYFTGKTKVTIQAWVRSETNSGLGTIVGNYNYPTNNNSMQMMLRRDGANYAFWLDSGSGYTSVSAVGSVVLNTWQHVTGTWDGTTMRIYIDGVLANSSAKTGVIPSRTTSFSIGSNTSERFDGDIDEVRLWDMALTATDIMNTMNCEAQSQPELVAYYKFNQGNDSVNNSTVTSLLDSSSNANNGTLTSFALTGATSNWRSGSTITIGNTCATLGNSDFENVNSITIYPNPSTGIFNIVSQQNVSVEIYDLLGKLVYNQSLANGTNSIDISNINTGVYLLKVTDANGNSESHKLIKN